MIVEHLESSKSSKKVIKMTISARNFPLLQIIFCIPSYSVASFFKEYHNPKVKANKMVN